MSLIIRGSFKPGLLSTRKTYERNGEIALKAAVEMLLEKIIPITPFETGELESSLFNKGVQKDIHGLVNRFGFDAVYAAIQHEAIDFNHPGKGSKNPGRGSKGQAKYVERPMRENRREIARVMASYLRGGRF